MRAALLAVLGVLVAPGVAAADSTYKNGSVYARVGAAGVTLGNPVAERTWTRAPFRTAALVDRRGHDRTWSSDSRDFSLALGGVELGSESFRADAVSVERLDRGGLRVTMTLHPLAGAPPVTVTRTAEAYPGVAGFRTQTTIESTIPLALSRASLDEAAVGSAAPTIHAFRAGADWREPGYEGPPVTVGDPHAGTWRESRTADAGQPLQGPGEWLSTADAGRSLFMVLERNDFPSSRAGYDGRTASVGDDFSRDVIVFGPLEENAHVENPGPGPARARTVRPGEPLALEPVFTGFGSGDGDEPWQFHKYLVDHRLTPYQHAVTFNSNGVDDNRISTGAKDDMDYAEVQRVAPIAKRLGVETFILDDGWQARSGDWQPDSPEYPEPRYDGSADSKFAPRFPDSRFVAVRQAIAPMKLGLWMSPTFFNPSSQAYADHPEWECRPVGDALVAANEQDPGGGSNEAGLGPWGPAALPYVETRIRDAIDNWGVVYFKFDFIAWLDCLEGPDGARDLYGFHDAFLAMLDRLRRDHPGVTFQIDETNDYRLFPFESVSRGPTWFQNGGPAPDRMLHNLWNLSPYVPAFALGQNALANQDFAHYPVDTVMAASLLSHITFFSDLRRLPDAVVDGVAPWTAFYKRNREAFGGVVYPLLADPLERGWTALQSWDPEAGQGALLAFRQGSEETSRTIVLRDVPPKRTFELLAGPEETPFGTFTSAELASGITVELPEKETAKVLLIRPVAE
jgi:hypothetical protein